MSSNAPVGTGNNAASTLQSVLQPEGLPAWVVPTIVGVLGLLLLIVIILVIVLIVRRTRKTPSSAAERETLEYEIENYGPAPSRPSNVYGGAPSQAQNVYAAAPSQAQNVYGRAPSPLDRAGSRPLPPVATGEKGVTYGRLLPNQPTPTTYSELQKLSPPRTEYGAMPRR